LTSNGQTPEKTPGKYTFSIQGGTFGTTHFGDVINSTATSTTTQANINVQQLEASLQDLVNKVNIEAQKEDNLPAKEAETFQKEVNELANTTKDLGNGVNEEKKKTIREKLKSVAVSLVRMSPKIARTVVGFTPLAPFKDLIGESFDKMVNAALNEKPQ
jgi:hypothetical protein